MRFDRSLAEGERAAASRQLLSVGAKVVSWSAVADRTYALVAEADVEALRTALPEASRVDVPPLTVLAVRPRESVHRERLAHALGGPGRPAGVVDLVHDRDAVVVAFDAARTPLALVVDVVDAEVGREMRTIVPLLGLSDDVLASFAAAELGEPALDGERILERHAARALAGGTT